jgi:hypothetical protein
VGRRLIQTHGLLCGQLSGAGQEPLRCKRKPAPPPDPAQREASGDAAKHQDQRHAEVLRHSERDQESVIGDTGWCPGPQRRVHAPQLPREPQQAPLLRRRATAAPATHLHGCRKELARVGGAPHQHKQRGRQLDCVHLRAARQAGRLSGAGGGGDGAVHAAAGRCMRMEGSTRLRSVSGAAAGLACAQDAAQYTPRLTAYRRSPISGRSGLPLHRDKQAHAGGGGQLQGTNQRSSMPAALPAWMAELRAELRKGAPHLSSASQPREASSSSCSGRSVPSGSRCADRTTRGTRRRLHGG